MIQDRIQLQFLGAAGEVTGSSTLVAFKPKSGRPVRFLIDCGLFQGAKTDREKNRAAISYDVDKLDAVFITHAHLDHSGLLPKLGMQYRGAIYCTNGTHDLLRVMLTDSAKLQEEDAEFANRTGYSNHKPAIPLYAIEDAKKVLKQLKPLTTGEWFQFTKELSFRFHRTGHIVGASSIEVRFEETQERFTLGFSGDVGHFKHETLEGPSPLFDCDALVLESTYGDRVHEIENVDDVLCSEIKRVIETGGALIVPAFAVGRAQELIYRLRRLEDQKRIPEIPIVLDSPMSEEATEIYLEHPEDYKRGSSVLISKQNFFPRRFEMVKGPIQSQETAHRKGPIVIISASGMLQGGRVLHHLKTRLGSERNTVLFVGYQAEGTKGKYLQSAPPDIRIHHELITIKARIVTVHALSGHADQPGLIAWVKTARVKPGIVVLNHGSVQAARVLAEKIEQECKIKTIVVNEPRTISFAEQSFE